MPAPEGPYLLARYRGRRPASPPWFDRALANAPQRTSFSSQGAEIELLCWGDVGKPGLLFLHGNGAHADWWSPIAPFFADEWRCAALSFSGMGRSDRRVDGYTPEVFAEEVRDAIASETFNPGLPCIVVAHSLGGLIALVAAADHPTISGLIIIDSPLGMDQTWMESIREKAPKAHPTPRTFATLADGLARFRLSPPQPCSNDYMVDYIARTGLVEDAGQWAWHFDPHRLSVPPTGISLTLERVSCPMVYLYGERSELVSGDTLTRTKAALPPGTPLVAIPDAAHHVPLDQPLALVTAMRGLLRVWSAA